MAGIQEQVERFEKGEIRLATCVVSLCEMLDLKNKLSATNYRKIQNTFYRRDMIRIAVDIRVAEIARQIRDFYFLQYQKDGLPTLELGDAVHLAAAIHYGVNEFVTFDERDLKRPSRPKRGLLSLNGNVANFKLTICKPYQTKPQLPLALPARQDEKINDPAKLIDAPKNAEHMGPPKPNVSEEHDDKRPE